jgi:hypothetical protein
MRWFGFTFHRFTLNMQRRMPPPAARGSRRHRPAAPRPHGGASRRPDLCLIFYWGRVRSRSGVDRRHTTHARGPSCGAARRRARATRRTGLHGDFRTGVRTVLLLDARQASPVTRLAKSRVGRSRPLFPFYNPSTSLVSARSRIRICVPAW